MTTPITNTKKLNILVRAINYGIFNYSYQENVFYYKLLVFCFSYYLK